MRAASSLMLLATPAAAQVVNPVGGVNMSNYATKTDLASAAATIPTPATTPGTGPTDSGTVGTLSTVYALANHTHPSKARRGRSLVPSSGTLDITFSPTFTNTPVCVVTAEAAKGDTNIVNAQWDGPQSTIGATIRINRTAATAVSLIGLTVLAIATPVATYADWVCIEP